MKVIIGSTERIATLCAEQFAALLTARPNAVLGLATGSTPIGMYAELARMVREGRVSFKDATSFNLDEYVGLAPTHEQSYKYFMMHNLFEHVDMPFERIHVPSGLDTAADTLAAYDKAIEAAGGVDLQLLGIGHNGHIGFNEPGTPFGSRTHIVELTESTIEANSRFFASRSEVPTHAATMGVRTVMNAKAAALMAPGQAKADIVKRSLLGPVTEEVPASVLQLHPDCTFYLDEEAASLL